MRARLPMPTPNPQPMKNHRFSRSPRPDSSTLHLLGIAVWVLIVAGLTIYALVR